MLIENAAEFPFWRANDGSFFLDNSALATGIFIFEVNSFRSTKTTESIQILIGKVYLSALLREKKDGGMCPARVAKRVLREQKHILPSLF
ncbi:MAG: hypothetical protein ACLU38_07385 [Dysosmobacter sp.]